MNANFNQSSKIKWKETPKWLRVIWIVAIVNFFSFFFISLYLGGSASIGKQENGKFYLGEHGRYTEVSENVFEYSEIHGKSIWITHPAALFSAAIFIFRRRTSPPAL
jgi:hypothetical protein